MLRNRLFAEPLALFGLTLVVAVTFLGEALRDIFDP
jgi:ABC-type dipeptide/oligopeptide/nickel transport system permease subunit